LEVFRTQPSVVLGAPFLKGDTMYQKPEVQRFGTFRDLTQAGGANEPGDGGTGSAQFHRY
jgi:hypothetical protein